MISVVTIIPLYRRFSSQQLLAHFTDNYDTQSCVNDGKQPQWLKQKDFFGIKQECCEKKVEANYDVCMGIITYLWSVHSVNSKTDATDVCPSSTGWAASSGCHSYFMCQNGKRTGPVYDCADNLLFDESTSECKHPSKVKCDIRENAMTIKSENISTKPTRRPTPITRRPTPKPTKNPISIVSHNKKPIASLWFGVSVTNDIKKGKEEEDLPQGR